MLSEFACDRAKAVTLVRVAGQMAYAVMTSAEGRAFQTAWPADTALAVVSHQRVALARHQGKKLRTFCRLGFPRVVGGVAWRQ